MRRTLLPTLLAAAVAACGGAGPALPGVALPVILERIHERSAAGELRVLDEMSPPPEISVETVRNRHEPAVVDTVRTLHYRGLDVEVYRVTSSGKEIARRITVTDDTYATGLGFAVGSDRAEVVDAMGTPARTEGSTLSWELTAGDPDPTPTGVTVELGADDRVRSVTWEYYVD